MLQRKSIFHKQDKNSPLRRGRFAAFGLTKRLILLNRTTRRFAAALINRGVKLVGKQWLEEVALQITIFAMQGLTDGAGPSR